MTLFDVLTKREAEDTGLPKQASDAELLAWSQEIRRLPDPADDIMVIDYQAPRPARRRLVAAAPQPSPPRRVLRARPLVASPATELDYQ
ncbi:MAG TPA: hypothetical protein VIR58_14030 [Acidimicrobiales bacterium]